uniref:E3 ubiquitin-protein ligase Topors n=1 Tax=Leptobrachium leishanense TaxID=445787 RepID=A0A8C5PDN9_9ANUR
MMREKRSRRRRKLGGMEEAAVDPIMPSSNEDFTRGSNFSPKPGTSRSQGAAADASPDSKCPICLDRFDNVSHLDRCLHRFCFCCIKEWAKNKAECPLCKQPFNSIYHSVQALDDFKEYVVSRPVNGSIASPDYLTRLLTNYRAPWRSLGLSVATPDHGVLFDRVSHPFSQQRGSHIHQMLRRLASRRQASAEGRSMRQIQEQELINFRRALYVSGVRVRNVQDGGRYRDISAEFFRRNSACLHRLVPWLKRELTVLFGSHGSLVNMVQHIIMSNVTRYDMESQAFVEDLRPFLLLRTEHFMHEFINYARSPFNIEAYDQHANYDCPAPSYEEGSGSESSIIAISPDDVGDWCQEAPESSLPVGEAPWDDETPGPSYSSVDQPSASVSTTVDISGSSDDEPSSSSRFARASNSGAENIQDTSITADDCVIVGYVKPLAERTPELVELSSNSEDSLCEVKTVKAKKPLLRPFNSSEANSSKSSPASSIHSVDKKAKKENIKASSSKLSNAKKKEKDKKPLSLSSRNVRELGKDKAETSSYSMSRRRARSRSSDCYSRSSRNKGHDSRRKHHSKNRLRDKAAEEKTRHKSWRGRRSSRSRDRSLSWRSRTVSLTSESSRERDSSRSWSRNHSRGRSKSHDSKDNTIDNYCNHQWEFTYYSRNWNRDGYEQSYKRRGCGIGHYSRPSASPEYRMTSYSERKGTRREKDHATGRQHHRERHRSRSRSSSQRNTSSTDRTHSTKPGGKRKYKTRHLENKEKEEKLAKSSSRGAEEQPAKSSTTKRPWGYKNDLTRSSSMESKHKSKRTTRSPSVEIVYEGKTIESTKHHKKKKKKKHKKKRRREQTTHSPASSPIIITIDSDSEAPVLQDPTSSNSSLCLPICNSDDATVVQSQPSSTSPMVTTTDLLSEEATQPYSNSQDLCSNDGHASEAADTKDSLHFDSSEEQTLSVGDMSPNTQTHEGHSAIEKALAALEDIEFSAAPLPGVEDSESNAAPLLGVEDTESNAAPLAGEEDRV